MGVCVYGEQASHAEYGVEVRRSNVTSMPPFLSSASIRFVPLTLEALDKIVRAVR